MTTPKPFGEMTDAEKGALLLAKHEGKRVEYMESSLGWLPIPKHAEPLGWRAYRIAPEPLIQDSINWDHVSPKFKYMARDSDGEASLCPVEPEVGFDWWERKDYIKADNFASYKRGTTDWRDSLVIRPGYEAKS